eukprot:scaffold8269_cov122-Isochrysis_galbana.AAC.2
MQGRDVPVAHPQLEPDAGALAVVLVEVVGLLALSDVLGALSLPRASGYRNGHSGFRAAPTGSLPRHPCT